ncbi:hypothetical protein PUN28_014421 [Cardiocondyla obscurior]|uniref:Uncharacterized protein n=1 Tax=Cardiocondyla obscurior TaxID=286306 RepID=A0AAW2F1N7_9HYME
MKIILRSFPGATSLTMSYKVNTTSAHGQSHCAVMIVITAINLNVKTKKNDFPELATFQKSVDLIQSKITKKNPKVLYNKDMNNLIISECYENIISYL